MRILDVSPRVVQPPVRGSSVRTANLLARLAERHEVRQFSQARMRNRNDPESARGMTRVSGSYAELGHASPLATLATEIGTRSWVRAPVLCGLGLRLARPLSRLLRWAEIVVVEFPWQFAVCRRMRPDLPMVLAAHNVEVAKFADYAEAAGGAATSRLWLRRIEALERVAVEDADLVLAVSAEDRSELIRRYGADPSRVVTVPNGADTIRYAPATPEERHAARRTLGLPERPTVLFAGADNPPNRAGLAWVNRLTARADHLTFLVTGGVARPSRNGIVAVGLVDDFGLALAAADYSLCPIEFGGGTKIKLLEGLAAGLPTVAFAESIQGLALDGEVLVAPKSEDDLLAALDGLVDRPEVARRLAKRGRDWVVANHDWGMIARRLEEHLVELV
jgi:glycosyltransferase involved in cell wall biosynthesis